MSAQSNIGPGPISPQNNPPINPQYYQPSQFFISDISIGAQTTVTTVNNHNYVIGQNVRLIVPAIYGTIQLNEQEGYVISIPAANQVVIEINSTQYNNYISNPVYSRTKPQIVAVGDINSGPINATGRTNTGTYIQGSFINISPN